MNATWSCRRQAHWLTSGTVDLKLLVEHGCCRCARAIYDRPTGLVVRVSKDQALGAEACLMEGRR